MAYIFWISPQRCFYPLVTEATSNHNLHHLQRQLQLCSSLRYQHQPDSGLFLRVWVSAPWDPLPGSETLSSDPFLGVWVSARAPSLHLNVLIIHTSSLRSFSPDSSCFLQILQSVMSWCIFYCSFSYYLLSSTSLYLLCNDLWSVLSVQITDGVCLLTNPSWLRNWYQKRNFLTLPWLCS